MDEKKRIARLLDKPLTRRQQKFVMEIVSNDGLITAREAAIRAGYPVSSAHARAHELMNPNLCPHTAREIQRYRDELDERYEVGYKRHIRDLQVLRDKCVENNAWSAAVQAERLRGMAQGGIYVNKSEVRTGAIDAMSVEDVERELERIRQGYEKSVIDITPTEISEQGAANGDEQGSGIMESFEPGIEEDEDPEN
jgi:phage terminase small subunit|tara:strand:- start:937 stop:1524 length:588 start_codon:yes stop_codon:yes gene_type:complete